MADEQELSLEGSRYINRQCVDRIFRDFQKNLNEGERVQINWNNQVIGLLGLHNRAEIVERMIAFLVTQGHFDPSVN